MAGVDLEGGGGAGRRSVDATINMVPFIDLLMVTVSFLLITAVWTSLARVPVAATDTHGATKAQTKTVPASLHVRISSEKGTIALQWQDGTHADDIVTLPLGDGGSGDLQALRDAVRAAYAGGLSGRHLVGDFDGSALNEAYVHAEAKVPLQTMMAVIEAIEATPRKLDEKTTIPAFHVSLSST